MKTAPTEGREAPQRNRRHERRAAVAVALFAICLASLLGVGAPSASAAMTVIPSGATAISAGGAEGAQSHDCAIVEGGTARCWGGNNAGQLGNGTTTSSATPVAPLGLSDVVAISAGGGYTCALIDDGTVHCWGSNFWGRLGDDTGENSSTPVQALDIDSAVDLSAGEGHSCAVESDGTAQCWGENISGQLGNSGPSLASLKPVPVSTLSDAATVSAGLIHTCALQDSGTVRCWGGNNAGQLGAGTSIWESTTSVAVAGLSGATAVSVRGYHSCALLGTGSVDCWGRNFRGELGDGTTANRSAPVAVAGLSDATAVSAGYDHTCALRAGGAVECWGSNEQGQLGSSTPYYSSSSVPVYGLSDATAVSAGYKHTCALRAGGAVECWGSGYGPRDIPAKSPSSEPKAPPAPPSPPRARITSHPPKETADRHAVFTFTGAPKGTYECSVDTGPWRRCKSGEDFGPLLPGDHRFRVRETLKGLTGPADSYSWTIALPKKCVLRVARARVSIYTRKRRVRLVIHYKTYRPADVTVSYRLFGERGGLSLGSASSHFRTGGKPPFRLPRRLGATEMRKVRAASFFKVGFKIPGTPGSCARYYTKRLTIPKRFGSLRAWFQSDSIFGVGWGS